jgi:hypothetical protein
MEEGELSDEDDDAKSLSPIGDYSQPDVIQGITLVDDKAITSSALNFHDKIFEVDYETRQYKPSYAVTGFYRSNQGKESTQLRSLKGLEMALDYLIKNVVSCDQTRRRMFKKEVDDDVTFLDIFDYAHDRVRAIKNDLTKISSYINITPHMVLFLEKMSRFYLVSLYSFYCMKYSNTEYTDDQLKLIDGGISTSTKLVEEYLVSLLECMIDQFTSISIVMKHLRSRKT